MGQNQIQKVPEPTVSTYTLESGDVCFTEEDAIEYFEYVFELENEIEDARSPF